MSMLLIMFLDSEKYPFYCSSLLLRLIAPRKFHQGPISFYGQDHADIPLVIHKSHIDKIWAWCLIFCLLDRWEDFLNLLHSMVKSTPGEDEYAEGLRLLSSLISGNQRGDAGNWSHAFEMMRAYLEVKAITTDTLSVDFWKKNQTYYHLPLPCSLYFCSD